MSVYALRNALKPHIFYKFVNLINNERKILSALCIIVSIN
jgi:hypothetical protein